MTIYFYTKTDEHNYYWGCSQDGSDQNKLGNILWM